MRYKYRTPGQTRSAICKSRPYARGHHTARTCAHPPLALLVADEIPAYSILVQCSQPDQSLDVAVAVGEVDGSADLRLSAAEVIRHHHTAAAAAEAADVRHHQTHAAAAEAAAAEHNHTIPVAAEDAAIRHRQKCRCCC